MTAESIQAESQLLSPFRIRLDSYLRSKIDMVQALSKLAIDGISLQAKTQGPLPTSRSATLQAPVEFEQETCYRLEPLCILHLPKRKYISCQASLA